MSQPGGGGEQLNISLQWTDGAAAVHPPEKKQPEAVRSAWISVVEPRRTRQEVRGEESTCPTSY